MYSEPTAQTTASSPASSCAAVTPSATLPQTVVLDRRGVVTYNKVGSVTHEVLRELIEAAKTEETTKEADAR